MCIQFKTISGLTPSVTNLFLLWGQTRSVSSALHKSYCHIDSNGFELGGCENDFDYTVWRGQYLSNMVTKESVTERGDCNSLRSSDVFTL